MLSTPAGRARSDRALRLGWPAIEDGVPETRTDKNGVAETGLAVGCVRPLEEVIDLVFVPSQQPPNLVEERRSLVVLNKEKFGHYNLYFGRLKYTLSTTENIKLSPLRIYLENIDLFYIKVSAEIIKCDHRNSHSVYHAILAMIISSHFVLSWKERGGIIISAEMKRRSARLAGNGGMNRPHPFVAVECRLQPPKITRVRFE